MYYESFKEMLDKLHEIFQLKSKISCHMLLKNIFSYSKDPADSIAKQVLDMSEHLAVKGEKISKNTLMTTIMMSLPSAYDNFYVVGFN